MSLSSKLGMLGRLKPLLTGSNLAYLNQLLTQLTDAKSLTYNTVWSEFRARFPENRQAQEAYQALQTLLRIVQDQRKAGL